MELIDILTQYVLQKETDFAVLLDGAWGSGKTHFLKNEFGPCIAQQKCRLEDKKGEIKELNYELVYVSLFGVSTLDDLQRKLFTEVNPVLKTKVAKGVMMAANKVLDFFSVGADDGDTAELMNILGGIRRNKILVFDDLERLSDELLNEVMGFINTYTEHQGLKVIIIAHEEIISEKVKDYASVKEKLIRFTYTYAPDLLKVLPTFLSRYNDLDFTKFIKSQEQTLLRTFERGEHINLRTLRFFLDLLYTIYQQVDKMQGNEAEAKAEILQRFFYFLLTYCIQYKKQGMDKVRQQELKGLSDYLEGGGFVSFWEGMDNLLTGNGEQAALDAPSSFIKDFENRYIEHSGQTFRYYDFIVRFVHSGDLDAAELQRECRQHHDHLVAIKSKPEFAAFHKLENCLLLEDEEFIPVYQQVLDAAFAGIYPLETYPKLFEIITNCMAHRIQGVATGEDFIRDFKAGMDKSIIGKSYKGHMAFVDDSENNDLKQIRNYAKELNESLLEGQHSSISALAWQMYMEERFDELDPYLQTELAQTPIFKEPYFDPEAFVQKFINLKNHKKRECIQVIQRAFERFTDRDLDSGQVAFWNKVYDNLSATTADATTGNRMSSISIRKLVQSIRSRVPPMPVTTEAAPLT